MVQGPGLQYWLTWTPGRKVSRLSMHHPKRKLPFPTCVTHRKVTNPTNRIPHPIPHQPSPRFHYTTKGNFNAICSSAYLTPELYSALKDADGSVFGWWFFFFNGGWWWRSLGNHALDFFGVRKNWWCLRFGEGAANIQPEDANESAICLFRWIFQITSTSWWVDILGHAGSGLWGCLK